MANSGQMAQALCRDSIPSSVSLKDRLTNTIKNSEERAAEARRALELLEKNPDMEEILNILPNINF